VCARDRNYFDIGARSPGRRYFPRFYRGNLSRRIAHNEQQTKRKRDRERQRERDTLLFRNYVSVYKRRDIADIEESANVAPVTLRAFIAIYLSAMHYTSLGILVFSPSTLNPRSNAGIHPLLFAFLDRAASSENACREAAFYGYRRYSR